MEAVEREQATARAEADPPTSSKDDKGESKDNKGESKDDKGESKDDKGESKDEKGESKDNEIRWWSKFIRLRGFLLVPKLGR
jgi:hypothetical protein